MNLKKIGIEPHTFQDDVSYETFVEVKCDREPDIEKESRLFVFPKGDDM